MKPLSLKKDTSKNILALFIQLAFSLVLHLIGCSSTFFCSRDEDCLRGKTMGLIRAPATQQFSIRPPRTNRLPLQPNLSSKYWLRGARQHRKTGLPAMASPLAKGRLAKKYLLMMVRDAFRFKESPQPVCRQKKENSHIPEILCKKPPLNINSKGYLPN